MNILIVGADIGADSAKLVYQFYDMEKDELTEVKRVKMPSVYKEIEQDRRVVQYENSPWFGLHMAIDSPSVNKTIALGHLAKDAQGKIEMPVRVKKSESEQVLMELFGYLAAISAEQNPNVKEWEQPVIVVTGIPLREYKFDPLAQKRMNTRVLQNGGMHTVKFLQTPEWEGKTCELRFLNCKTVVEGIAATKLVVNKFNKPLIVADLGGSSMEMCAYDPSSGVNSSLLTGNGIGVNATYDSIIQAIEMQYGVIFRNRNDFVEQVIIPENYDLPQQKGNIQSLVESYMKPLSVEVTGYIKEGLKSFTEAQSVVPVGGGMLALRPYLTGELLSVPIEFYPERGEEVWLNALVYLEGALQQLKKVARSLVS